MPKETFRLLPVLIVLLLAGSLLAAPKLAFLTPSGQKIQESLAEGTRNFSLNIANQGDEPLIISRTRPSCSCTKVLPEAPVTILPGRTNEFALTVDLAGELKREPKNFSVRLECNDPIEPSPLWFVTIPVLPCLELNPRNISFRENSAPTQTVLVVHHGKVPEYPIKPRFLSELFKTGDNSVENPEHYLSYELFPSESPYTNRLAITRLQPKVLSRYGTLRLSLDAGPKFNVLQIETERPVDSKAEVKSLDVPFKEIRK